ncbi:hypothetical protein A0H81_05776 [Grifola frondosa]|uniref:Uncharacterized protein n=1 Tax=Grifola frondosa TaxID=5627 RepID=A0A1C7MCZ2_GRIFR|nr:hypothetical protein A0H81_05776 [Grifola frondosa]
MSGPPSAPGPSKGSARFTLNAGFRAKVPTNASNAIARTTQSLPKWDPFASLQSSGSTPARTLPPPASFASPIASAYSADTHSTSESFKKARLNNTIVSDTTSVREICTKSSIQPPSVRMSQFLDQWAAPALRAWMARESNPGITACSRCAAVPK